MTPEKRQPFAKRGLLLTVRLYRREEEEHRGEKPMATKALVKVLDPFLSWAAVRYQAAVGDVLRKHGLRYEDLYDPLLNAVRSSV